jgi:HEAT repeat protein
MLGNIGDERAIPHLTEALKDPDEEVRFHVARNLGKFEEPAVPFLLDALKDPDEHVRRYAAWILGVIGDERALPALKTALEDPSEYVRKGVEQALKRFD